MLRVGAGWLPTVRSSLVRASKAVCSSSSPLSSASSCSCARIESRGNGVTQSARRLMLSRFSGRAMSSGKFDWKNAGKDKDFDPYLPHRIAVDNAKAALEKLVKPGMSEAEIEQQVAKVFEEHIPPAPHWIDIIRQHDERVEQEEALRKQQAILRTEQMRALIKMPSRDALGRAYSTGKRKRSVARVWVTEGNGTVIVNRKHMVDYFPRLALREEIYQPLMVTGKPLSFNIWCTVAGGGKSGQAGAIKLGVARALQAFDPSYRKELKKVKLLTQDDRQVERKKPGRTKARRRFQWVKR